MIAQMYEELKAALQKQIKKNGLAGQKVSIRCQAISSEEAIGKPEDQDYPLIKGKEVMVEAVFRKGRGQAFTDEFENLDCCIEDLLEIELDSNSKRANFISSLNAVYRDLGLCDSTIHCKNEEPKKCSQELLEVFEPSQKILLVGYQPRFFETLALNRTLREVDLDKNNIGRKLVGVVVEPPDMVNEAVDWCDTIFATGSTVVNGTIGDFLNKGKPAVFYGVTISAPAKILNLNAHCRYGH